MTTTITSIAEDVQSKDASQPPPSYSSVVAGTSRAYGPTPIGNQLPLPQVYYDPVRAMEEANHRARRRFFGALCYALGIWVLCGFIMGGSMMARDRHQRH